MAVVSCACDTIVITLPIMTLCITCNLVFRIVSLAGMGVGEERSRGAGVS